MKKSSLYALIATMTTLLATAIASSACYCFGYQPEEPASLSEK